MVPSHRRDVFSWPARCQKRSGLSVFQKGDIFACSLGVELGACGSLSQSQLCRASPADTKHTERES